MTKYTHYLHVLVPASEGRRLSDEFEKLCPDVGPDNFCETHHGINATGDDGPATHYEFNAPVEPRHYAAIAPLLKATPGVKFLCTDRQGNLQKTERSESPTKRKVADGELVISTGLKRRVAAKPTR